MSPFPLPKVSRSFFSSAWLACCTRDKPRPNVLECEKLILHIHGGGFISMTSRSHQNYTRRWAVDVGCPVVSVDYRLAPDAPYPAALDDVWQTYMWLRENAEKELGLGTKKIVIAGDSAGGNLAIGCVVKALMEGVQPPDGLFLAYPALSLSITRFTPSFLYALDDLILHHTFLKLCLKSYVADPSLRPDIDPFLSPIVLSPGLLSKFPPVRIIVGSKDPLHDDCWRLTESLQQAGANVKLVVFEGFTHGALNFALKSVMEEGERLVAQSSRFLVELFTL